jgi:hypothetical protein
MKIKALLKDLVHRFSTSFKRFPVSMAFAAAMVVVLIIHNQTDYLQRDQREFLERLSMILAMGFPMSLIVRLYWEQLPGRRLVYELVAYGVVAVLLVLGFYFLLPELGMVQATRYTGYMLALFLVFLLVPYRKNTEGFEAYVVKLFTAFFVTYLYSGILYAGLSGILGAIHILFEVEIPSRWYFNLFLIVSGFVAPAVFLGEVPRTRGEMDEYQYSKVLKVLLLYIVMPLLVAYTAILYAFFIRLLLIREWPPNLVSHLVVWYGIFTAITLFLSVPLREQHGWARTFARWIPAVILVPFGILFYGIVVRIHAYGFTEPRYFLLITGLWLTGAMIHYLLRYKKARHLPIVAALAAVAFLSVTGPWSGYAVSKWSQSGRFDRLLAENELRGTDGQVQPNQEVPEEAQKSISSILQYYERYHDVQQLGGLPEDFEVREMETVFGFAPIYDYGIPWEGQEYFSLGRKEEDPGILNIEPYDYMTSFYTYRNQSRSLDAEGLSVIYHQDSRQIRILSGETILYGRSLDDMVDPIIEKGGIGRQEPLPREELVFTDETETVTVMVAFRYINGVINRNTEKAEVEGAEMEIFFTVK